MKTWELTFNKPLKLWYLLSFLTDIEIAQIGMDNVTLELTAESEVHPASSSNAHIITTNTEGGNSSAMLEAMELVEAQQPHVEQSQQQDVSNEYV